MAASETEDSDILWCINHDSFPFKKPLMETQVGSQNKTKLRWQLRCAVTTTYTAKSQATLKETLNDAYFSSAFYCRWCLMSMDTLGLFVPLMRRDHPRYLLLWTQHWSPSLIPLWWSSSTTSLHKSLSFSLQRSKMFSLSLFNQSCQPNFFLILYTKCRLLAVLQGSHIFQKLRPVDQLRHLLVSCAGGESEEVERFFKLHRVRSFFPPSNVLIPLNRKKIHMFSGYAL